jgi:hypothetical protein
MQGRLMIQRLLTGLKRVSPFFLILYPYWYMHSVLLFNTQKRFGNSASDMNLTIRELQFLKHMQFPWSWNYRDNFPKGIQFFRIEHIVDSQFKTYSWLFTRIFEPTFVANFYIFSGMVATGLIAYLLTLEFIDNKSFAVAAGLLAQALPWIRQNALFGVAGTWYPVAPLVVVLLLLRFQKTPNVQRFAYIALGLLYAALTSAYAFFFSLFIITVWIVFNLRQILGYFKNLRPTFKILFSSTILILLTSAILVFRYLLQFTKSETGSPFTAYTIPEVMTNIVTFRGFITPDRFHYLFPAKYWEIEGDYQNYVGVVVVVLFLSGIIFAIKTKPLPYEWIFYVTAFFLVVITLGNLDFGFFEISSPRVYLRHVMPGIRQFSRASLIAEVIIVIGAVLGLYKISRLVKQRTARVLLVSVVLLASFLDLNPTSRRFIWDYAERFEEIRQVLDQSPKSGIFLATPIESIYRLDKGGRSWDYIDAPIFTDYFSVFPHAARGEADFASFLTSINVDFVLARIDNAGLPFFTGFTQDAARFTTLLNSPRFVQAADDVTLESRDDEGNLVVAWKVRLLRVKALAGDKHCRDCNSLAQFTSVPPLEVKYPETDRYLNDIDWAMGNDQQFSFEELLVSSDSGVAERGRVRAHFEFIQSPNPLPAPITLRITSKSIDQTVLVESDGTTVSFEVPINEKLSIKTLDPCQAPLASDDTWGSLANRPICFGIRSFWIESF